MARDIPLPDTPEWSEAVRDIRSRYNFTFDVDHSIVDAGGNYETMVLVMSKKNEPNDRRIVTVSKHWDGELEFEVTGPRWADHKNPLYVDAVKAVMKTEQLVPIPELAGVRERGICLYTLETLELCPECNEWLNVKAYNIAGIDSMRKECPGCAYTASAA